MLPVMYLMIIENLDKIIGLAGVCIGIEIIAGLIAMFIIVYIRNPYIAGVIGSLSSISMSSALIFMFLRREPN
jgi:hypothetical protein